MPTSDIQGPCNKSKESFPWIQKALDMRPAPSYPDESPRLTRCFANPMKLVKRQRTQHVWHTSVKSSHFAWKWSVYSRLPASWCVAGRSRYWGAIPGRHEGLQSVPCNAKPGPGLMDSSEAISQRKVAADRSISAVTLARTGARRSPLAGSGKYKNHLPSPTAYQYKRQEGTSLLKGRPLTR